MLFNVSTFTMKKLNMQTLEPILYFSVVEPELYFSVVEPELYFSVVEPTVLYSVVEPELTSVRRGDGGGLFWWTEP